MDCIFCKIVAKEIPAKIVTENSRALALLDIHPLVPGHTVVVPKQHADTILELGDEEISPLFALVKQATNLLNKALQPDGFTIGLNHGEAVGQGVPHLHVHILPRWTTDGGGNIHSIVKNPPSETLDKILERIQKVA
ncbi:MAG: HIT family protein [Candidatus Harrisonbacteria bacterium CG10_big_fil_rev_8_21_14_0_10_49_15]|uniref:HIT family protein n=1 Tax=Candidatus Harrisonbacteria bacterium CG10_big_fil_rev_8_21_14_0_10_49_15 TaxID=1974587 RepID=A0A2H0UJY7_9BACT|nr:MAG: HIT family protein [Candidatus Harrisonbacteria bacterium CG10_big_fil_rev_8_21_14_0_10_49_15]